MFQQYVASMDLFEWHVALEGHAAFGPGSLPLVSSVVPGTTDVVAAACVPSGIIRASAASWVHGTERTCG